MGEFIKYYGEFFSLEIPLLTALLLGIIYILAFLGAVYYGIDLCQKFKESTIGKPIQIILALTPIFLILYPSILKYYPQELISINATIGVLEILSLIYFMIWKTFYIIVELLFKSFVFLIRVVLYALVISIIVVVLGIKDINQDYIFLLAILYRLFEIKDSISNNFQRVYGNLIYNLKCLFSF